MKGEIVDFQAVGKFLPIIEFINPYNKKETKKNAFDLGVISKTKTITITEWKLVNTKYTYIED